MEHFLTNRWMTVYWDIAHDIASVEVVAFVQRESSLISFMKLWIILQKNIDSSNINDVMNCTSEQQSCYMLLLKFLAIFVPFMLASLAFFNEFMKKGLRCIETKHTTLHQCCRIYSMREFDHIWTYGLHFKTTNIVQLFMMLWNTLHNYRAVSCWRYMQFTTIFSSFTSVNGAGVNDTSEQ